METAEWQQSLVFGRLRGCTRLAVFSRFVGDGRRHSRRLNVRGALLFDGEVALHLIEGERRAVDDFIGAVYSGDAHADIRIVASRSGQPPALPPHWQMGYTDPQVLDAWGPAPAAGDAPHDDAEDAVARFLALLATADCA